MEITCPRCGFNGETTFEFDNDPMSFSLLNEWCGRRASCGATCPDIPSPYPAIVRDEEIGEYIICPRCISVYTLTTDGSNDSSATRSSGTFVRFEEGSGGGLAAVSAAAAAAVPHVRGDRQQQLALLSGERLRRFSPEAQERLRSRMESYLKAHRDSSFREDATRYLQRYIIERLRTEERRRMRLSDLTCCFATLSAGHPFYEALARLQSSGRIHSWEEPAASGADCQTDDRKKAVTETMVRLV